MSFYGPISHAWNPRLYNCDVSEVLTWEGFEPAISCLHKQSKKALLLCILRPTLASLLKGILAFERSRERERVSERERERKIKRERERERKIDRQRERGKERKRKKER